MGQEDKKPEDPGLFEKMKDNAKDDFNQARQDVNDGIDGVMRFAHKVIGTVAETYKTVEDTVGRDRIIGMGVGAKAGAIFMATKPHAVIPLYVAQIGLGTMVGGAAGFVFGPSFSKRYRLVNAVNDDTPETPPASKPADPSP